MRHDKDCTKTGEDRIVELCPRALEVLKHQLAVRARMKLLGKVNHDNVFFREDGTQIRNLNNPRGPISTRSNGRWNLAPARLRLS